MTVFLRWYPFVILVAATGGKPKPKYFMTVNLSLINKHI